MKPSEPNAPINPIVDDCTIPQGKDEHTLCKILQTQKIGYLQAYLGGFIFLGEFYEDKNSEEVKSMIAYLEELRSRIIQAVGLTLKQYMLLLAKHKDDPIIAQLAKEIEESKNEINAGHHLSMVKMYISEEEFLKITMRITAATIYISQIQALQFKGSTKVNTQEYSRRNEIVQNLISSYPLIDAFKYYKITLPIDKFDSYEYECMYISPHMDILSQKASQNAP